MKHRWTALLWELWAAQVLCAAAVLPPGSAFSRCPALVFPGLALSAAVPAAWTVWAVLAELPAHVVQSTLGALIWVLLPLVCAFLRPRELLLSAVAAARGFVLAMTVAVSVGEGNALIIGAAGVPAVLSVSALLAACSMVWQGGEATGRYSLRTCRMPYFLCITLAVLSALLRAAIAALCDV